MDNLQIFSTLAFLFIVGGYVPYIVSILKGVTVPSKASWLIWACMDSILLYGMIMRHAVNGQILGTVFVIWVVVVLSLGYGRPGWTLTDKVCLVASAISLILVLRNPTWSIALLSLMSFVGAIPTFRSAWDDPSKEDKLTWIFFWISCVLTIISVPIWDVSSGAQPISFFIVQTTMVCILLFRKNNTGRRTPTAV